jgi:hypothetical protein
MFTICSWAQAELGVVMDVIDGVLANQTLRVQTISCHGESAKESKRASYTEEHINLAVEIFMQAKNHVPDTSAEIEDLRKLVSLKQSGWPVLRLGLGWYVNYSHESILNLPLDMNRIVPVSAGKVKELESEHRQLLTISLGTQVVSISQQLLVYSESTLGLGLLSSLDIAIYSLIREKMAESLSDYSCGIVIQSSTGALLKVSLVDHGSVKCENDSSLLPLLAIKIYNSFIKSRGKDIDL